jgi:hypothetical protein
VLAGCIVSVAVVVAATVFGSNLTDVASSPARYGWPWQVGVVTGAGYGSADVGAVDATLAGRADVRDYGLYGFDPATRLDGEPVPVVYGDPRGDVTPLTVVDGRNATALGEIVLGSRTAHELGVRIGDQVSLESPQFTTTTATVVGTAVLPSVGSFVADRSGLGRGAFLATETSPDPDAAPAFVAIRLREGTDPSRFVDDIDADLVGWDLTGAMPVVLRSPVRPPEIVNIREMQGAPLLLAGSLTVALAVGLAMSISVSVRDHRRDLAILRALGLGGRALESTVRWQAISVIAIGLVAGMPLGIVAGRVAWRAFAEQLGIAPHAQLPLGRLVLVAVAGTVIALVAAQRPGRSAARLSPAEILRTL